MKLGEVIEAAERIAPLRYSTEYTERYGGYDNSGLILGDRNREITRVLLCLDATEDAAEAAADCQAQLVMSHHPIIYYPVKSVTDATASGRTVMKLMENRTAVYAAHFNLDVALVNDVLADLLGLTDCRPIFPLSENGMGRVGRLKAEMPLSQLSAHLQNVLADPTIFAWGQGSRAIRTVAVLGGGGGGEIGHLDAVERLSADAFITAEFKHHVLLEARSRGIAAISASHYGLEAAALSEWRERLLKLTDLDIRVYRPEYPYR